MKLKVSQPHIVLINAAAFLLMLAVVIAIGLEAQSSGRGQPAQLLQALVIALYGGYYLMEPRYAARSAMLEKVEEGHALYMPLESQEMTEELSDSELLDAVIDNAAHTPKTALESPEWTCAGCGQSNPGDFDVCWSCQKARKAD